MPLTIEQFGRAEGATLSRIGYAQHAAISAKTFTDYGFPERMTEPAQLVRYIDFFVGARLETLKPEQSYRGSSIETNYSEDEAALLQKSATVCAPSPGNTAISPTLCISTI